MPRKARPKAETEVSARREQLRAEHAEAVREKIQTTEIVKVLQDFALGREGASKLDGQRLKAIEMLLDKTVPNLASVKHEIETDKVAFFINTNFTPPKSDSAG